jgi:hypothetical protein
MFTKIAYFIPLYKEQKKAEHLVKIFAREIWRFHSILIDIISDQDSRFTSTEWKQFLGILEIRPMMSTCHTPPLKTHFENGNSYQVMTEAIGQELLPTTLHLLPTGNRIMGG